jgi:hypothetical protein
MAKRIAEPRRRIYEEQREKIKVTRRSIIKKARV